MDINEFKLKTFGIDKEKFGTIYSFVDFGNVNYWYEKDIRDWDNNILTNEQKLIVSIEKLANFLNLFSHQKRFYYGWHQRMRQSWHLIIKAEHNGFIKVTKPIQFIKHYLDKAEQKGNDKHPCKEDFYGRYIEIPKSNFDVEISVDSIRLMEKYNTFCLMSGDSDFAYLASYLKKKGKKIIVIASGQVFHSLKETADLYINAQDIKKSIADIKKTAPR